MDVFTPTAITRILKERGLSPNKKLGQNFLCDENVIENIAAAAVTCPRVLEIGPGLGALTQALLRRAERVTAVELDSGLYRHLCDTFGGCDGVSFVHEDFLKADLSGLARSLGGNFCVAGNLPYYITSKCIMRILESGLPWQSLTVMVQRELADRLAAQPGTADYGALTVQTAYFGGAEKVMDVSRHCFYPKPEVDSAVVRILPRPLTDVPHREYARVVRALFAMRRKTAANNMAAGLGIARRDAEGLLEALGIRPDERAERLSPLQFAEIARSLNTDGRTKAT